MENEKNSASPEPPSDQTDSQILPPAKSSAPALTPWTPKFSNGEDEAYQDAINHGKKYRTDKA